MLGREARFAVQTYNTHTGRQWTVWARSITHARKIARRECRRGRDGAAFWPYPFGVSVSVRPLHLHRTIYHRVYDPSKFGGDEVCYLPYPTMFGMMPARRSRNMKTGE